METQALIERMERFGGVLPVLVEGLDEGRARWRPPSGAWSITEIVHHLADEEELDFRARLRSMLEHPGEVWPPTDPEGWAVERRYNERTLGSGVDRFVRERRESVRWLRSLGYVDWGAAYPHPRVGPVRAGELLCSWPAHDALHVRQIAKRLYELAEVDGRPEGYGVRYAGEWGA